MGGRSRRRPRRLSSPPHPAWCSSWGARPPPQANRGDESLAASGRLSRYPLPSTPSIDTRHAKLAHEFVRIILRLLRNQEELVGAAQRVARGAPELCSPPIAIGAAHSRPPPPCVRRHTRRSPRRVSSLSAASEPSRRAQQTAPSPRSCGENEQEAFVNRFVNCSKEPFELVHGSYTSQ